MDGRREAWLGFRDGDGESDLTSGGTLPSEGTAPVQGEELPVGADATRERRNIAQRQRRAEKRRLQAADRERGLREAELAAPITVRSSVLLSAGSETDAARERRNELQRKRRAEQKRLQVISRERSLLQRTCGVPVADRSDVLPSEDANAGELAGQSQRALGVDGTQARRNEFQRLRRAEARRLSVANADERMGQLSSNPQSQGVRISPVVADQNDRATRIRDARRRRVALGLVKDEEILVELSARVLQERNLSGEEVEWMATNQRYLQDPRLALAYYYCCGTDPGSFVFGDEQLRGDDGELTRERILKLLDDYPKADDIAACQSAVLELESESTTIWACASCGIILLQNSSCRVLFSTLEDLQTIRLSEAERNEVFMGTPESIVRSHRQLFFDDQDIYYLIPDLVRDRSRIPLCEKCHADPRKSKFSVAAGHDYGRLGNLGDLNDVALLCISPARCFGLTLTLSGKHSTGHAICFPTNGPCELARTLPRIDEECMPRVTFIGPRETWRIQRRRFTKLYDIPVDDVYQWLVVLSSINDVFKEEGIEIEDSPRRREMLRELASAIQNGVEISDSSVAIAISDNIESEFGELNVESPTGSSLTSPEGVFVRSSAVLPPVEHCNPAVAHEIISAMVNAVSPGNTAPERPVILIKRARSPFVEWVDNAKLLASVFPNLFLTGSGPLPSGPLPKDYVHHFMHYWDGRFEKSVMFTTMLFNQMQRHVAVRKAARVGVTHGKTMEKFGKLINTDKFKQALEHAHAYPDSNEAVRMNASLLRLLSLVGGTVPFSPFERAATRPKLAAMRYRYGIALHWVTLAPPEHDDLILHRVAGLRGYGGWNDQSNVYVKKGCRFKDLPMLLQREARARLGVSALYPALSAQVFERRLQALTNDILRCRDCSGTRSSTNYLASQRGVYGRCAAFNAVIEPQADGRLHAHMTVYGAAVNPSLLARVFCCPELVPMARQYLNAVSSTSTTNRARAWCDNWRDTHDGKMPRAFEIEVPDASCDYQGFIEAAENRALSTNVHSHSATCRKGVRGRYVCRLSRPAGVHEGETEPIYIQLKTASVLGKRQRAEFAVHPVTGAIADRVDAKFRYAQKRIIRQHTSGAIVWEQRRPARDAMFVETNLSLACLTRSHTNSAVMNGEDAGDMVEEYQQSYMTKEKGGLKGATAAMYTAIGEILKYPSVAEDSGSALRTAKHLATRTVNDFSGSNEWSHSLMAYALAGYRSYLSSDSFWFVFPHKLVEYVESNLLEEGDPGDVPREETVAGHSAHDDESQANVHDEIDELIASTDENSARSSNTSSGTTNTGARMYRLVNNELVVVTQAESYRYRGAWFAAYSPLEFEMIVDLLPRSDQGGRDPSRRGRPRRRGFDLAHGHPLAPHFQGFIRAKFKTPMLGGAPLPDLKDGCPSEALSKYLLCLLTAWSIDEEVSLPDLSPRGLRRVCKAWNSTSATFINRQRYQYLHNILKKRCRSFANERACSEWRSRNAEFWIDEIPVPVRHHGEDEPESPTNNEDTQGKLSMSTAELCELTIAATAKSRSTHSAVEALKADFWAMLPDQVTPSRHGPERNPVFLNGSDGPSLAQVAREIHAMRPQSASATAMEPDNGVDAAADGPGDNLRMNMEDESQRNACSTDQREVFDMIFQSIDGNRRLRQTLTLLHGGGGTGKSTLIRRIVSTLERHGVQTVSTCPTGVGASHLPNGRTFHSAFKANRPTLSANDLALLRLTFTDRVWLVVVDEVSMLSTKFLVLLDVRLRAIYGNDLPFGGRSVILSGDFLQLKVTSGIALCKTLYSDTRSSVHLAARALFVRFRAVFLTHQHRAASCPIQQANLEACRSCPAVRPSGERWTAQEKQDFRPVTEEIVQSVTRELDADTIAQDSGWLDEMTILVTSNFDKAVLTSCTSQLYAKRNGVQLFRWKRELKKEISPELNGIVYDESVNPELFAYFVAGAPAQVLDNNNGNVSWGVANGTTCKLHSLAWQSDEKNELVQQAVANARTRGQEVVDLPFPPDFINVQLVGADGDLRSGHDWPDQNNLETEYIVGPSGARCKKSIIIPVGVIRNPQRKPVVHLGVGVLDHPIELEFVQHAVDLAQVITVWKAQGATLKRVVLNLEPIRQTAPKWGFEHLYVGISRVTAVENLRCLPLSGGFRSSSLRNLRPDIYTTKWRFDNQ